MKNDFEEKSLVHQHKIKYQSMNVKYMRRKEKGKD